MCVLVMCTYILNSLLVYHTFIHFCTYMFLCNQNNFLSMSSLCWTVSSNYSDTATYDEKQQKIQSAFKHLIHQAYFMLTTILHQITHNAASNLPLYKTK